MNPPLVLTCAGKGKKVVNETAVKIFQRILMWIRLARAWGIKYVKTRLLRHTLRKAQHNLDRRMGRLGAEFYFLHRQGEKEFLKSLVVLQHLKIVEDAESRVFALHDRIDAVEQVYLSKKEHLLGKLREEGK